MQKANLLRTLFIIAVGLFFFAGTVLAEGEWTTSGPNIFNTNSGNIGIGTTAPSKKLHIVAADGQVLRMGYDTGAIGVIDFYSSAIGAVINIRESTGTSAINLDARPGRNNYFNNGGNVGIGTTNATKLLTLNKQSSGLSIGDGTVLRLQSAAAQYAFSEIGFNYNGASGAKDPVVIGYRNMTGFSGYTKGDFFIATRDVETDTTPLERLTVKTNGNVGIGTTNATKLLTLNKQTNGLTIGDGTILRLQSASAQYAFSEIGFNYHGASGSKDPVVIGYRNMTGFSGYTKGDFFIATRDVETDTAPLERLTIKTNGNVGIGTANPQSTLAVNGTITTKKVKVTEAGWSDFVFDEGYKLPTLAAVESHIKQYKHLPGIPSARDIQKKGLDVSDVLAKQMQKIEELTLYVIELQKQIEELKKR